MADEMAGTELQVDAPSLVAVRPGERLDLHVRAITKKVGDDSLQMLSYNGSIPGPTLHVQQGSEILVNVVNESDLPTTVHWHGLRLDNRYDGVPHATQEPIPPGGSYTHRLRFPDAGLFWYHPHVREDYSQELGLYGNILVEPSDPTYWPPADGAIVVTLDDILIENGEVAPFDPHGPNFVAMGRYGNTYLVSGEPEQRYAVRRNEVVRLYLTNTANTRVFKVAVAGLRMKLVGGDAGRYEHETLVDDVVLAPSERAVVDLLIPGAGSFVLQHTTPLGVHVLAHLVADDASAQAAAAAFSTLRENPEMGLERRRVVDALDAEPDKTLAIVAEMDVRDAETDEGTVYVCPMHPEVVRDEPGQCPKCGMKLLPQRQAVAADHEHAHHHEHVDAVADGIEWEDTMVEVNRATTPANMRWKLIDRDTGKVNADIDWRFATGDQVKIRLVNEMGSDHPMHHPFHIHGERFLVLSRGGVTEPNLVWKDTVLVRTGETVDILMDASNPGMWMAHCHIPEHMGAGMMMTFNVVPPA